MSILNFAFRFLIFYFLLFLSFIFKEIDDLSLLK